MRRPPLIGPDTLVLSISLAVLMALPFILNL